ncbi:hypothetical protein [Siphonobacter curvatus]|uniref:Uncharacterized protein n=1 Tax=Siphonobacter curvatus TaxID=2094562 RepID=A0A2S7IR33_9BACT|nr:hypothetical protein [Siphonobacter curvatus]PQA60136.1 hypothetical protein C5O19_11115 [Siphonobacter curvatus]
MITEGCRFEISPFVDALLDWSAPVAGQTGITVCPNLTLPYFLKTEIDPELGSSVTGAAEIAIKAKLHEDQFPGWKDLFFTNWIGAGKRFLTWQADHKLIERNQPEFLYFLLNMQPKPSELRVRCHIQYMNGTTEIRTIQTARDLLQNCVYCIPTGFEALGLPSIETATGKEINAYTVWLNNERDDRISEYRTYLVNQDYTRNVRFLIFQNTLGGFDTLRCWGQASTSLTVTANLAQKTLEAGYLPSFQKT